MPEEIKVSRTAIQDSLRHDPPHARPSSKMPWIILVLVVVIIAAVAILFRDKVFSSKDSEGKMVGDSGYHAVFLSNGQVYFGKLSNAKSDYPKLTDIYYLQVIQQQPLQGTQQTQQQQQEQQRLELVKLGSELHGPVDEMFINREQILFYEKMKADGKVYQAIKEYKANPPATGQSQAPAPAQSQQQVAPNAAPNPAPSTKTTPPAMQKTDN